MTIEGIKITMAGRDLQRRLHNRASVLRARAVKCAASSDYDVRANAIQHERKADRLAFVADHLTDDDYRFTLFDFESLIGEGRFQD